MSISETDDDSPKGKAAYTTYRFVCKGCSYEGLMLFQNKCMTDRKKTNQPVQFKDGVMISELCWICDYKKKSYNK